MGSANIPEEQKKRENENHKTQSVTTRMSFLSPLTSTKKMKVGKKVLKQKDILLYST